MASQPKVPRYDGEATDLPLEVDHDILESVDSVQEAIDSLNKKASVEILKVEQKFNKLRKPHYEHRAELLAKIPHFWLTVFKNHLQLRKLITEEDEKVLALLKAVEVQEFEDITSGYRINFYFEENDWFKNECITKEYHVGDKGEPTATSTKIEWKPDMDLTEIKGNGKDDQKREYPQQSSFFCWFTDDCDAVGDVIGESIKDELWPNPLQFYLTPDTDSDESGDDLLDEEDDEEEEEDEDEDGQELAYDETGEEDPKSS
ncbi:unnamed protein product [Mesocestoides corti]|nr:unnamed protein product [Mesocestoides corti]